jgi:hypothetical protein
MDEESQTFQFKGQSSQTISIACFEDVGDLDQTTMIKMHMSQAAEGQYLRKFRETCS